MANSKQGNSPENTPVEIDSIGELLRHTKLLFPKMDNDPNQVLYNHYPVSIPRPYLLHREIETICHRPENDTYPKVKGNCETLIRSFRREINRIEDWQSKVEELMEQDETLKTLESIMLTDMGDKIFIAETFVTAYQSLIDKCTQLATPPPPSIPPRIEAQADPGPEISRKDLPNWTLSQRYLALELVGVTGYLIGLKTSRTAVHKLIAVTLNCSIENAKKLLSNHYPPLKNLTEEDRRDVEITLTDWGYRGLKRGT